MQIVKMTSEDAFELSLLDKECFNVPWSEQSFLEEANNPIATYFLAKIDEKIVGYCGVWLVADEGQITNIAVHPEYRRKNIASALLKEVMNHCKDARKIILEVRESNAPAICLYEKFAFKKVGIRKNFYHSPQENGITMIWGEI